MVTNWSYWWAPEFLLDWFGGVSLTNPNQTNKLTAPKSRRLRAGLDRQSSSCNSSPLLRLPAELRKRIYAYAMLSDEAVDLRQSILPVDPLPPGPLTVEYWDKRCEEADRRWQASRKQLRFLQQQPALARTCKLIRAEALPIFYGETTFLTNIGLHKVSDVTIAWLSAIGPDNRTMMKRLYVVGDGKEAFVGLQDLTESFGDGVSVRLRYLKLGTWSLSGYLLQSRACLIVKFGDSN